MEHTKGKLHVGEMHNQSIDINHSHGDVKGAISLTIAKVTARPSWIGESEANARRLVACWNACEEISTESLELGIIDEITDILKAYAADRDRLQALNAELVAALEIIARGDADRGLQMRDIARAALAKAKEAQS